MNPPNSVDSCYNVRVCIVAGSIPPVFSGAGLRAYRYAARLHKKGRLAFIITERSTEQSSSEGILNVEMDVPEDKVIRLPKRPFRKRHLARTMKQHKVAFVLQTLRIWLSLFLVLFPKQREYDIVFCFGAGQLSLYTVFIARLLHKKVIVSSTHLGIDDPLSIHNDKHVLKRRFRSLAFSMANGYISISGPITVASRKAGVPAHKVWEIPNPIDTGLFSPCNEKDRKSLRKELGINDDKFTLVFVGSIIRRKGVDLLIEALGPLCNVNGRIELLLIGSYSSASEEQMRFVSRLHQRINALGIVDRVKFIGVAANVHLYMKACDVFVFPSRSEGFPNVIAEAMASGLPVVTCEMSGIAEYMITHEKDGFIVDYTPDAIARTVEKLYCDPHMRLRVSRNAVNTVRLRFSVESVDAEYDKLYDALLRHELF